MASTFSIKIDAEKRKLLESMAKSNYRSLNGEINMALDLYIKQMTTGGTFVQIPRNVPVAQEHEEVSEKKEITIDDFGDDEVDDI